MMNVITIYVLRKASQKDETKSYKKTLLIIIYCESIRLLFEYKFL